MRNLKILHWGIMHAAQPSGLNHQFKPNPVMLSHSRARTVSSKPLSVDTVPISGIRVLLHQRLKCLSTAPQCYQWRNAWRGSHERHSAPLSPLGGDSCVFGPILPACPQLWLCNLSWSCHSCLPGHVIYDVSRNLSGTQVHPFHCLIVSYV